MFHMVLKSKSKNQAVVETPCILKIAYTVNLSLENKPRKIHSFEMDVQYLKTIKTTELTTEIS